MDLVKFAKRRTFWSEVVYIGLNVALALGVFLLVRSFDQQPYLAVILVLLSKWRIFAVRPRYWFAHIQGNLVDIIVGLSAVALLYQSEGQLAFQIGITALYITWLLILKPRSHRGEIILQASVAQFVGLVALGGFSHIIPSSLFVLSVWLVTFAAARHVLSTYSEKEVNLLSITYAFMFSELAWFYYHWMIAYPLVGAVAVPQLAIVALLIGFVAQRLYDLYKHKEKLTFTNIRGPLLFLSLTLIIIFSFFTEWTISV